MHFNYVRMAVKFTSTIDAASRNHHWREEIGPRQEQAATEQLHDDAELGRWLPDSALRIRNDAAFEIRVAHSSVTTPPHLRKRAL